MIVLKLNDLSVLSMKLIEQGLFGPSAPWEMLIMFLKKKNKTHRICINYHDLSKSSIRNKCPMPRNDESMIN